jgi:hypothetical protein
MLDTSDSIAFDRVSHNRARKEIAMLAVLLIAAVSYGGWRAARALAGSLRGLPRRNEDMIFY